MQASTSKKNACLTTTIQQNRAHAIIQQNRAHAILFSCIGLLAIVATPLSHAQSNKVVVVPLAGDSIDSTFIPVVVGTVLNPGGYLGVGVNNMTNPSTGLYAIEVSSDIGEHPVVLITPKSTNRTANYSPSAGIITVRLFNANGDLSDGGFSIVVYKQAAATPK